MFVEVARTNDLPVGRARVCVIGDRQIALYHTARGFFASENTCPHRGGPLGEGDIIGSEIVCPWHFWTFEIETGTCLGNPEIRIHMHDVRVEDDRILVRLT